MRWSRDPPCSWLQSLASIEGALASLDSSMFTTRLCEPMALDELLLPRVLLLPRLLLLENPLCRL